MSSTKGAIHFEITADNEDLKQKLAESLQAILNSGKAAETEGAKIAERFKRTANERIKIDVNSAGQFGALYAQAVDAALNKGQTDIEALLEQYKSYTRQREEVEKKFNNDRKSIEKSDLSTEDKADALQVLEQKRTAATKKVNKDEVDAMKQSSELLVQLFESASGKSVSEILKIYDTVNHLTAYLANTEVENITPQFGFTADQLKVLKESPDALKEVTTGVKELHKTGVGKNPFVTLYKDLKNIFSTGDRTDGSTERKLADLGASASATAGQIGGLAGNLSGMFEAMGNDKLAGSMKTVQSVMSSVSAIGDGLAKGGIVGGISALLSETAKGVAAIFKADDNKKEAEIQRLQGRIDVLKKSYDNLGEAVEKAYSSDAKGLIEDQNQMLEQQKVLIQNQMAQEESKKNTDNGKIKQYQESLDEINKTIEANKEKAIDALFGADLKSAIDNFATAYAEAWAKGESRAKSAKDTVRQMMRSMVIESIKASAQIEKIRLKLAEFYEDGVLSQEEQDIAYKMAEEAQKELDREYKWAGSLMTDEKPEEDRQATSKGITSMSQDSADELNGRFTAMQGMLFELKNNQFEQLDLQRLHLPNLQYLSQLSHLSTISENTAYCRRLEGIEQSMGSMKNDINTIVLKGITIKK